MSTHKDYWSPSTIFGATAGVLFGFAIIWSIIPASDGVNIGAGFVAVIGLIFAALASRYRNPPSKPDQ